MLINAENIGFQELNERIRESPDPVVRLEHCLGQRYIGCGISGKRIEIPGIPGNALGAYLDGGELVVYGNAQDAVGDTMNAGRIAIHGSAGDAAGYAMRGGTILIQGDTGYRAGIHMKEYREQRPALIVGGTAGSFLGEYQAGGVILVLGLERENRPLVGNFCGTGMHGGKIYLRSDTPPADLPSQVAASPATDLDREEIRPYIEEFCREFGGDAEELLRAEYTVLAPNTKNPYKRLYTMN